MKKELISLTRLDTLEDRHILSRAECWTHSDAVVCQAQ